jgi:hypothetical protein
VEVEALADTFGKALTDVYQVTSGTYDATKLTSVFAELDAAHAALFDQVFRLNRAVHADQHARREKRDGRSMLVVADDMMLHAEDVIPFAATSWNHLDKLDIASLEPPLRALEASIEELSSYALAHPTEATDELKERDLITHQARAYAVAVRQLIGRARDHIEYTEAEKLMIAANNESAVAGTPGAMIAAYNVLVDIYGQR